MTKATGTDKGHSIILTAARGRQDLAAATLSRHLGIPVPDALVRLSSTPSVLAADLQLGRADHLATLLGLLGFGVRIGSHKTQPIDLCAHLKVWADPERTARKAASALSMDAADLRAAFRQTGCIVVEGLDQADAGAMAAQLRNVRGLVVTLSERSTALYDLFPTRTLHKEEEVELDALAALLGVTRDPLTDAVIAGLERRSRDLMLARLPHLGLRAIDRAFQRFDLVLTGATGWTSADLADFLVGRTQRSRAAFEQLSPAAPVTLDLALDGPVARQFCADYAAIGLLVRPILSTRGRNA